MMIFVRGHIVPEHKNPINHFLIWIYRPLIEKVLKAKVLTIVIALVALGSASGRAAIGQRVHAKPE